MKIIILIILTLIIILALFLYWSDKAIVLTRYTFKNKKIKAGLDGLVITQVSDLQSTYFGRNQKNLLKTVKSSKPDMIIFTGDVMDRNHTDYKAAITVMEGLVEIGPVYFVNGNHDFVLPEEEMVQLYEHFRQIGVNVLFDEALTFTSAAGGEINVLGMSENTLFAGKSEKERHSRARSRDYDPSFIENSKASMAANIDSSLFTIMLAHEPHYFKYLKSPNIDLIFSGHAHGGQIRLPGTEGLYAPGQGLLPKLTRGLHTSDTSSMIISRGLGNSTFPFRVFNRPEIVTVVLKKE